MSASVQSLLMRAGDDEFVLAGLELPESIFGQNAQAAVEKYLKALLLARDGTFPYTHDIERLHDILIGNPADTLSFSTLLESLTDYASVARYNDVEDVEEFDRPACKEAVRTVREYVERRLQELGKL